MPRRCAHKKKRTSSDRVADTGNLLGSGRGLLLGAHHVHLVGLKVVTNTLGARDAVREAVSAQDRVEGTITLVGVGHHGGDCSKASHNASQHIGCL